MHSIENFNACLLYNFYKIFYDFYTEMRLTPLFFNIFTIQNRF